MVVLFLHAAPPPSIKALTPACGQGGGSWPLDTCLSPSHPHPQLPRSEIKQIFLSTTLACLLAFEQRAAGPPQSSANSPIGKIIH